MTANIIDKREMFFKCCSNLVFLVFINSIYQKHMFHPSVVKTLKKHCRFTQVNSKGRCKNTTKAKRNQNN